MLSNKVIAIFFELLWIFYKSPSFDVFENAGVRKRCKPGLQTMLLCCILLKLFYGVVEPVKLRQGQSKQADYR